MKENKKFTIQKNRNFSVSQNSERKSFVITKKVAKHGKQAIIVIPRILEEHLKPGTLAEITIDVLEEAESSDPINKD